MEVPLTEMGKTLGGAGGKGKSSDGRESRLGPEKSEMSARESCPSGPWLYKSRAEEIHWGYERCILVSIAHGCCISYEKGGTPFSCPPDHLLHLKGMQKPSADQIFVPGLLKIRMFILQGPP